MSRTDTATPAAPASNALGLRAAAAAVAVVGLGIAAYLTVVHYAGGTPVCAISHGCATVQQSEYAELAGVPVALLGVAGYVAILTCVALDARSAAALLSLSGAGFSAWLTYVEVAELHAICSWCVASAVCMTLLAGISVARVLEQEAPSSIR
jgi:uncharacterized membrane protein